MIIQPDMHGGDLFYETLIQSYVDAPRFVERPWLVKRIKAKLAEPACRFLMLTAEPGAGKTAFMAWLASQQPDWPRYFIRRDSQTPMSSGDARSFLFAIGHQLAAQFPTVFHPEKLEIAVEQRIGELATGSKAVGITVEELTVSPFYKTSINVKQDVKMVAGDLEGLSVTKMVAEKRFLELENLQYLALFDPAQVLLKEKPDSKIVILIDALDELRYYHGKDSILDWLATCPELPFNIQFIISSRPEDLLNILRQRQQTWLKEEVIDTKSEQVQADLRRYAENFTVQKHVKEILAEKKISSSDFIAKTINKADGNFQYMFALSRGIEQAIERNMREELSSLLRFEDIPVGLEKLYAFFLTQIKSSIANQLIEVRDATALEIGYLPAWEGLYQPVIGILAVAKEPLEEKQIKNFGVQVEERWLHGALERLGQFLDHLDGSYRLYHNTFQEFVTSPDTQKANPECYLSPAEWHHKIASHYWHKASNLDAIDWRQIDDYGLRHLPAHFMGADLWNELTNILTNFDFMEEKCKRVSVYELEADYQAALEAWNGEQRDRVILNTFRERLSIEINSIYRSPELLFPQLYNYLTWLDAPEKKDDLNGPIHSICERARRKRTNWIRMIQDPRPAPPPWSLSLEGHTSYVAAVAVTHDGKYIVSGAGDNTIRIWEKGTGRLIRTLGMVFQISQTLENSRLNENIRAIAITPDDAKVVSGLANNAIKVWDLSSGRLIRTLEGHIEGVGALAITPDGTRIVSGSNDKTIKIWDLASGRLIRTLEGHTEGVQAIAVTPNGSQIVTSSNDKTIKVWDLASGHLIRTLEDHIKGILALIITYDGTRIISGSNDKTIKIWDLASGNLLRTIEGHTGAIRALAVSMDTRIISGAEDDTLRVWDINSGSLQCSLTGHTGYVTTVVIAPDCEQAVSGATDKTIKLWDLSTGQLLRSFEGSDFGVRAVAFTPDGDHIISGDVSGAIKVWDLDSGSLRQSYVRHTSSVESISITPDGTKAVSCSLDKTVKIWDIATSRLLQSIERHSMEVLYVIVTADGNRIVSGSRDNTVNISDLITGHVVLSLEGHTAPVSAVAVTPNGRYVVLGSRDNTIRIWDISSGHLIRSFKSHISLLGKLWALAIRRPLNSLKVHEGWVRTLAVTPDGTKVVSGSMDRTLKVWDLASGRLIHNLKGHSEGVTSLKITCDSSKIISGSTDKTIKVWDLVSGSLINTFEGHTGPVYTVDVDRNGTKIASGSFDNTIKIWELAKVRLPRSLEGHIGPVKAIAITHDGSHIISGGDDNFIRIWDITSGYLFRSLTGHTGSVESIDISPNNVQVISASRDNTVRIWDLDSCCLFKILKTETKFVEPTVANPKSGQTASGADLLKKLELLTERFCRSLNGDTGAMYTAVVSPDGVHLVSGADDNTVKIWELTSGNLLRSLEGHKGPVNAAAFTPNGTHVVTGSYDNTIRVWELATGNPLRSFEGHADTISAVAVTPNGKMVISGSRDKTIKIWDLESGLLQRTLKGHTDHIKSIAITSDGTHVVSASLDKTIKLWNLATGDSYTLFENDAPIFSLAISGDSHFLVCGDDLGRVWLFEWVK